VVSGAAYGVDGAAHRGAVAAGGATIAVLACGLDVGYPAGHVGLLRRAAESGAVISEYPPGTPPARHRFLVRNRLIAALGEGTVVVEAGIRSGARNTAASAAVLGRVVMAVPGPISSAMSLGCHAILRDGHAVLVGSVPEIIECTGRIGTDLVDPSVGATRVTDDLEPHTLRVYEACRPGSSLVAEQLAVASGVPLSRVRAALPELELMGLVRQRDGGWQRQRQGKPQRECKREPSAEGENCRGSPAKSNLPDSGAGGGLTERRS
jgi:DNA processing protein